MFKDRHFNRSVILLCMRWYLAYLRELKEMMAKRGINVDHNPSLDPCASPQCLCQGSFRVHRLGLPSPYNVFILNLDRLEEDGHSRT